MMDMLNFAERALTKQANTMDTLAGKLESGTPPALVADLLRQMAALRRDAARHIWQVGGSVQ